MATTPTPILQPVSPGTLWPVAYGYHLAQGVEVAKQVDGAKTTWSIHIFGKGEYDGIDALWVQEKLVAVTNTNRVHFHAGKDGNLGVGLGLVSIGPDQNVDTWFGNFPTIQPVTFSRLAYMILRTPFDPGAPSPDINPLAQLRCKKVRTFDAAGNQLSYAFSTNPWWQLLDVLIDNYIQRETTFNFALTATEKLRIDFPSFATAAAYADTVIGSGAKRFESSLAWVQSTTLSNVIEQLLLCARGYLLEVNGQFSAGLDATKASTFVLTDQHVVPGSFNMEKKLARGAADHFNGNYRDLTVPVLGTVTNIIIDARNQVHVSTAAPHGRTKGDSVTLQNISYNAAYNGTWLVVGSGSPNFMQLQLASAGDPVGTHASTGTVLAPEQKFAVRSKAGDHFAHQAASGQRGAGLNVQGTPVPVDLDYGNNTEERVNRLLTFQKRRTFGDDVTPYNGPWEGRVKAFLDSVDAAGNILAMQLCGDVLTIDRSVSEEFQGDCEILEFTLPQIAAPSSNSQSSGESTALEIELYLKQIVASAYSDDGAAEATIGPSSSYLAPPDPLLATNSCVIHILRANPAQPVRLRPTYSFRPISFQPYVVDVGDFIEYDVFVDPSSVYSQYGLQIGNSTDPTIFFGFIVGTDLLVTFDQNGDTASPPNFALPLGVWVHRAIDISAIATKTIDQWLSEWYPTDGTSNTGACRGRIANVMVTNGGLLKQAIFNMQFLGPSFVFLEQDCLDVRLYTADNGVIPLPPSGKLMLPNPGFESNVALMVPNIFQSTPGALLADGWTISTGSAFFPVCLEEGGSPHGGSRNLFFRIPTASALPIGTFFTQADSDFLPCLPGDVIAYGGWERADHTAALPAGLTVQFFIYLLFYDPQGTLLTVTAAQIIQQNGNSYGYTQVQQQCVVPSGAAFLRMSIAAQFINASGGVINTGANLYADLRIDDLRLINRTRSFDSSPVDSSVTMTNGGNILTQHVTAGVNQTQIDVAACTAKRGFAFIACNSGSVDPGAMGHWYVYFHDATFAGGALTYLATNDIGVLTSSEDIVLVGDLTTVANPGVAGSGGNGLDGGRGGARR